MGGSYLIIGVTFTVMDKASELIFKFEVRNMSDTNLDRDEVSKISLNENVTDDAYRCIVKC